MLNFLVGVLVVSAVARELRYNIVIAVMMPFHVRDNGRVMVLVLKSKRFSLTIFQQHHITEKFSIVVVDTLGKVAERGGAVDNCIIT